MDDGQWWVLRDGITLGPYSLAELRQYTKRGKLYADDLVSAAGEADWSPAALAPALADLFPKDGSEDATVALDPALRALAAVAATPVPARRSNPADSPLRGSTLPPRLPTADAPTLVIERAVDGPRTAPARRAGVVTTPAPADAAPAIDAAVAGRVAPDAGARPAPARAQCVGAAALAGVGRTRAMLRSLDELMRDASPPADPFDYGALATA